MWLFFVKIKGSKEGVYLIKNANRISSICNDVIGDICGIVSGSVAAMLAINISIKYSISVVLTTLIISDEFIVVVFFVSDGSFTEDVSFILLL